MIYFTILSQLFIMTNENIYYLQAIFSPLSFSSKNSRSNMFFQQLAERITVFPFTSTDSLLYVVTKINTHTSIWTETTNNYTFRVNLLYSFLFLFFLLQVTNIVLPKPISANRSTIHDQP